MLIDTLKRYSALCREASAAKEFPKVVGVLDELRAKLRAEPPSTEEALHLLQEMMKTRQLDVASSVFMSAWFALSGEYVPLLCDIVSDEQCRSWHEQSLELLAELPDARSIPALVKALEYRWDFDEWNNIPRKALGALANIGSPEAIAAIRHASMIDEESIRDEAMELLGHLGA